MPLSSGSHSSKAIEVFFSYSHKDEALRDQLAQHLTLLRRNRVITEWHDRQITAGEEWAGEIDAHLNSARLVLLLISPDFLASDYLFDVELTRALERHAKGEACVIPIILRASNLSGAPFEKLKRLPRNDQPVTLWKDRDAAFAHISKEIEQTIKELSNKGLSNKGLFKESPSFGGTFPPPAPVREQAFQKKGSTGPMPPLKINDFTPNLHSLSTLLKNTKLFLLGIIITWTFAGCSSQVDMPDGERLVTSLVVGALAGISSGYFGCLAWWTIVPTARLKKTFWLGIAIGLFSGSIIWVLVGKIVPTSQITSSGYGLGFGVGLITVLILLLCLLYRYPSRRT